MNKISKTIYKFLLMSGFIFICGMCLLGLGAAWSYFNSGADRASILQKEFSFQTPYQPEVTWTSVDNPGRPMEKQTLKVLQQHYLNAWYTREVALMENDAYGIADFYTEDARKSILEIIDRNSQQQTNIQSTTLEHHPQLDFYSADGQFIAFTDRNVEEYHQVYQNNKLVYTKKETSDYQVIMLLEDGFWRIRHIAPEVSETSGDNILLREGIGNPEALQVDGKPFLMKGVNYYPQANPWDMFGDGFDSEIINADFKIIQHAGLNTIRIFIPYEDFGGAEVIPEKIEKLKTVLGLAYDNQLKVVVTLFDFYGDYSVLNWTLTRKHAKVLVEEIKDEPALLAWDIKNEPDLDYDSRGKTQVIEWLKETLSLVIETDPSHPVTIGWSNAHAAVELKERVDFVSFHYYWDVDQFENSLSKLQTEVQDKPIVLQEFGMSSYRGIWYPMGKSKKAQAKYHEKMQAVLKKNQLAFISWTLYDFNEVPSEVVGHLPWRKKLQTGFGFLDSRGNPKPSFSFISY